MSDFPEKAPDKTNATALVVIGLATTAVLWAFVVYLQSYFENTEGEIAARRASEGRSAMVRDLKAEERADLATTMYADANKGTLKRLNIAHAKRLVIGDAKAGTSLIPSLGALDVPSIPAAAGRPVDGAKVVAPAPSVPTVAPAAVAPVDPTAVPAAVAPAAVPAAEAAVAPAAVAPTPAAN